MDIKLALDSFIHQYLSIHQSAAKALQIEYDADWPSACYRTRMQTSELVQWQPVLRDDAGDFSDLENALDTRMPAQLKDYFARYWSDNLNAETARGQLQLLQAWNQQDFERLQQNLIGHIMMKRRLKQPETWFFALTDEDDFILSIEGHSGNVVLERVGLLPQEVLSPDLASFITQLTPTISD